MSVENTLGKRKREEEGDKARINVSGSLGKPIIGPMPEVWTLPSEEQLMRTFPRWYAQRVAHFKDVVLSSPYALFADLIGAYVGVCTFDDFRKGMADDMVDVIMPKAITVAVSLLDDRIEQYCLDHLFWRRRGEFATITYEEVVAGVKEDSPTFCEGCLKELLEQHLLKTLRVAYRTTGGTVVRDANKLSVHYSALE